MPSPRRAVFLDHQSLDLGDLDLSPLRSQFDELELFDATRPDQVSQRLQGAVAPEPDHPLLALGHHHMLDALVELEVSAHRGEDILDDRRERFLHASPTTTAYQLYVASLAWFSDAYRQNFPDKAAAAEANATVPATTHALFHTMADMASIRGNYIDTGVSLVNAGYDRTRPRRYLNDHNEAVPFRKTGLSAEDMEVFRKFGIEP